MTTIWVRITLLLSVLVLASACGASAKDASYAGSAPMEEPRPESVAYGGSATSGESDGDLYVMTDDAPIRESESVSRVTMAQGAPPPPSPPPGGAAGPTPQPQPPPQQPSKPDAPGAKPGVVPSSLGETSRTAPLLIYTAQVNLAVFETVKILDAVEKLAKDNGGYLVKREARRIVIRIPSDGFDDALKKVEKLGDVLHKDVSVQDVTEEFNDLSIRIRNLEVVRNRLEDLLKKADKVPDAIAVERELERVTSQLERLKGRIKLLGELTRFSTITVELAPRNTDTLKSKVQLPFPWLNNLGLQRLLSL